MISQKPEETPKTGSSAGADFGLKNFLDAIDRGADRLSPTAQGSAAAFEEGWSGIEPKTAGFQVPQPRKTGCRARSQKCCQCAQRLAMEGRPACCF